MPLADWTFYRVGSVPTSLVTSPTPPGGAKWLRTQTNGGHLVGVPKSSYPHTNITRGRLRTLLQLMDTSLRSQAGLLCMCSQEDMRASQGGSAYGVALDYNGINGTRTIRLVKFTDGITDLVSGGQTIAQSLSPAFGNGVTLSLELSWVLDLPNLSGILLNVRTGLAVDFSDLAPVPNLTDVLVTSNVLTTAVTMGFFMAAWNSSNLTVYLDQTSLDTL
jgi:hypothetical protein